MLLTKKELLGTLRRLKQAALNPDAELDTRLAELGFPVDGKAETELAGLIERLEQECKRDPDGIA